MAFSSLKCLTWFLLHPHLKYNLHIQRLFFYILNYLSTYQLGMDCSATRWSRSPGRIQTRRTLFWCFLLIHHLLHLSICCTHRTPDPINEKINTLYLFLAITSWYFLYTGPLLAHTFADNKLHLFYRQYPKKIPNSGSFFLTYSFSF